MNWVGDDRAQSVQVGAVLLFATLIIALSVYQATVVPQENQQVEYAAYQDASADMLRLRNVVLAAAGGDGTRGVTFKTGANYPPRVFLANGIDPRGRVETTAPGNVTLGNVDANVSEHRNVGEYVAVEGGTLNYTTRRVRFDPDYNHLTVAAMVATNGFVYSAHDRPTALAPQTLVRGNTITVTTVAGDLDADGYTAPLTAVPVSAHVNTVTVTNQSSGPVTLTVASAMNASEWNQTVLTGSAARFVTDVTPGPRSGTVTVNLQPGEQYEFRVAKVELKERQDGNEVADPDARYLVSGTAPDPTTAADGRVKLVVEARDALHNPRSNWPVTFSSSGGQFETKDGTVLGSQPTVRSNEMGDAVVWFNKTAIGDNTVTATLGTDAAGPAEKTVTFEVSRGAESPAYVVDWMRTYSDQQNDVMTCGEEVCTVDADDNSWVLVQPFAESSPVVDEGTVEFEVNDTSVGTVSPGQTTTTDSGRASTYLNVTSNGSMYVYVSGGGSGDRLQVNVENIGQSGDGGGTAAGQVVYNDDASRYNGQSSGVEFSVRNTGSGSVTVTDVAVTGGDSSAEDLKEDASGSGAGSREMFVSSPSTNGYYEAGDGGTSSYDLGTRVSLSNGVQIGSGNDATFTLTWFQSQRGGGSNFDRVDMRGQPFEVTIYYSDGSQETITVTLPN